MTVQLCRGCNEPAVAPSRYCAKHIEWYRVYRRKQTKARQAKDLCTQCGKPTIKGKRRCERCRMLNRKCWEKSIEKKAENGICRYCTKEVVKGFDKCLKHLGKKQRAILGIDKPVTVPNPYVFVAIAAGGCN